jgi:hypothetical protein
MVFPIEIPKLLFDIQDISLQCIYLFVLHQHYISPYFYLLLILGTKITDFHYFLAEVLVA